MSYMHKYPLYIKSVDYGELDITDCTDPTITVVYADDSIYHPISPVEIKALEEQLAAQVKALEAGEVITYTSNVK